LIPRDTWTTSKAVPVIVCRISRKTRALDHGTVP
jgi:hypothetical protein